MTRNRITVVFDPAYSEHGLVIYASMRLLAAQLGTSFSYEVFCSGRYNGPKFARTPRIKVRRDGLVTSLVRRLNARLESCAVTESRKRWESNIEAPDEPLLRRMFAADSTHAFIIFALDPAFARRWARLAHIYSSVRPPHLIVVTPQEGTEAATAAELEWLRVQILRDGDSAAGKGPAAVKDQSPAPVFSFLDSRDYPRQLVNAADQIDWSHWIGADLSYPRRVRDIVLFVRPDWMNYGSGTTFGNLAAWFQKRDSLLIDVGVWPYPVDFDSEGRGQRVALEQENIGAALFVSARRSTSVVHLLRQIPMWCRWLPRTLARQTMLQYGLAAKPRLIRQAISQAKVTNIYLNHYFTYGYARDLIRNRPFFLDTHDIQAINFIHYNKQNLATRRVDSFEKSLRDEMEIAGLAQRLGFVSSEEIEIAARFIPQERLDYVLPLPRVTPCQTRPLHSPARLLIVASNNAGNVQSLLWFLNRVWPIVLRLNPAEQPPVLRICGGVVAGLENLTMPGVEFMGIVPRLRPYYEDTDLVLLPIVTGGGVAIKTLEAILHGRAALATRHALRGLPADVVQALGHEDDPLAYAEAIIRLCSDSDAHHAQVARSRQAASLLLKSDFYETLGVAVDSVRLEARPDTEEVFAQYGYGAYSRTQGADRSSPVAW